jgi:hypothetical protein
LAYEIKSLDALSPRFDMVKDALEHALCPLTEDEVQRAMTAAGAQHAQEILVVARRISVRRAARIAKVSGLSATDFAMAIGARFGVWPWAEASIDATSPAGKDEADPAPAETEVTTRRR